MPGLRWGEGYPVISDLPAMQGETFRGDTAEEEGGVTMFYVPGVPQPQGSSRAFVVNGKARITSANGKLKSWRVDVAKVAQEEIAEKLLCPVAIWVTFEFTRPKGHYGTGKNTSRLKDWAPYWHTSKPDADKLLRATLDALTGIAWRDDAQVASATCSKRYGERSGTTIVIQEAQE